MIRDCIVGLKKLHLLGGKTCTASASQDRPEFWQKHLLTRLHYKHVLLMSINSFQWLQLMIIVAN